MENHDVGDAKDDDEVHHNNSHDHHNMIRWKPPAPAPSSFTAGSSSPSRPGASPATSTFLSSSLKLQTSSLKVVVNFSLANLLNSSSAAADWNSWKNFGKYFSVYNVYYTSCLLKNYKKILVKVSFPQTDFLF